MFRRKDGKYLIYLPLDFAEDNMFLFKGGDSIHVKVSFKKGDDKLLVEKWKEELRQQSRRWHQQRPTRLRPAITPASVDDTLCFQLIIAN